MTQEPVHRTRVASRTFVAGARRASLLAVAWWAIAEGRVDSWWFGAPAVALATYASLRLLPPAPRSLRLIALLRLLGTVLRLALRGSVDVARRAIAPRPRLASAFLRYPLRVSHAPARVLLAELVSLTPGTLALALEHDELLLHVLDSGLASERDVALLEGRVADAFGCELASHASPPREPYA